MFSIVEMIEVFILDRRPLEHSYFICNGLLNNFNFFLSSNFTNRDVFDGDDETDDDHYDAKCGRRRPDLATPSSHLSSTHLLVILTMMIMMMTTIYVDGQFQAKQKTKVPASRHFLPHWSLTLAAPRF